MKKITPRHEDFSAWYNELVLRAGLAEHAPVRGCMVIKPYGLSLWEGMQQALDSMFKESGHQNAYFPLFIPQSYLSQEASHVEGFATECAVVTHYRLKADAKNVIQVDPEAKLEEPLIVRPTSETMIWKTYKKWIQSHRDLPLLINQWANVVRWEMRPRLFLRTAEFLWQEGHTAHATEQEAREETERMLDIYTRFAEDYMAIPVQRGRKSAAERFAGAVDTLCIEALMQDGKALQMGTSHFLGQNFAKAFDVQFANQDGKLAYVWGTSWGVSTRLVGALIMVHGDDKGLILPPRLAPIQVALVPIYRTEAERVLVHAYAQQVLEALRQTGIRVHYDVRSTFTPGWKFAEYELKGVPLRVAIGPRDQKNATLELVRRDDDKKELVPFGPQTPAQIRDTLNDIHKNLFERSRVFQEKHTYHIAKDYSAFCQQIEAGGFVEAYWDGTESTEQRIKEDTKAAIRYLPFVSQGEGVCVRTGKKSTHMAVFAKAY